MKLSSTVVIPSFFWEYGLSPRRVVLLAFFYAHYRDYRSGLSQVDPLGISAKSLREHYRVSISNSAFYRALETLQEKRLLVLSPEGELRPNAAIYGRYVEACSTIPFPDV